MQHSTKFAMDRIQPKQDLKNTFKRLVVFLVLVYSFSRIPLSRRIRPKNAQKIFRTGRKFKIFGSVKFRKLSAKTEISLNVLISAEPEILNYNCD